MKDKEWINTTERFVAFFDILGFKDLVNRNSHYEILKKLTTLKSTLINLENEGPFRIDNNIEMDLKNNTRSVTFSDSIIIFSKGNTEGDAIKIIYDCNYILKTAIENGISIKGAISFGEITVDFNSNLFFGQALIDSFLLHEDFEMLNVIIDHNAENQIFNLGMLELLKIYTIVYNTPMKYGKVKHKLLKPKDKFIEDRMKSITKLYKNTSGKPRKYIDNTIEYFSFLNSKIIKK